MTERGSGPEDGERVVVLLSGEAAADGATRRALEGTEGQQEETDDPAAALDAVESGAVLVVGDRSALARLARLATRSAEASAEEAGAAGREAAGSEAVAGRATAKTGEAAGGSPSLQIRRPARFSARPLHAEAAACVREAMETVREGGTPDPNPAALLAERLHTSLLQSNMLLLRALEPYKRFDLGTHCANVSIIAAKIAMGLEWSLQETLRTLQAGLLHDIGMMRLPERILRKEGPLSEEERSQMQRHPAIGAEVLEPLGEDFRWLREAVAQEHERRDGSGYPEGLSGDEIDPLATLLGVADVFEAFSHARSYRSPFTAYEALEKVLAMREEWFPSPVVDALANEISVFPLDSYVLLSTGEIGRVVASNPENLMRPTVEVLWDEEWKPIPSPERLPLSERPEMSVTRPLHEAEVPIT